MKKENIIFRLDSKYVCGLFVIVGICFIAIANVNFSHPLSFWGSWGQETVKNVGTTLIVAGIISFLTEISTLKNFFRESMKNILNEDFPFEAYSNENLEHFKDMLSAYLVGGVNKDELKNTIYSHEGELLKLAKGRYYKYHNATYTVCPNEKDNMIRISAEIEYCIINKFAEKNEILFKTRSYTLDDKDQEKFTLKKLKINNKTINTNGLVKIESIHNAEDSNFYDYKVRIVKSLGTQEEVTVYMEYEYKVPIYDRLQNYKITLPCQSLDHRITIKNDNSVWQLRGSAYTAFYCKQSTANAKYKVAQTAPNFINIMFNDWIFPGSGYSIYYDKK